MSSAFENLKVSLVAAPKVWLVTGCAGFIGSNLLEHLLKLDQTVTGLDNFSTGNLSNLEEVKSRVTTRQWERFSFIEGDIQSLETCKRASEGVDYVLHQAALGSVPRSIADPISSHNNNINGTLNMLVAARDHKIKRFVFASSSSVYGDHPALPKVEQVIGRQLSCYAVTKFVCELYADQFASHYGVEYIGLRYFNVFGQRQDPDGAYAAVIPKWIAAMIKGNQVFINGDGQTSRDFCYIDNVVQMNLLSATCSNAAGINRVYNVAVNARTDLNMLFNEIRSRLAVEYAHLRDFKPEFRDFRQGDVMHSHADIALAERLVGYKPSHTLQQGLDEALAWYKANVR